MAESTDENSGESAERSDEPSRWAGVGGDGGGSSSSKPLLHLGEAAPTPSVLARGRSAGKAELLAAELERRCQNELLPAELERRCQNNLPLLRPGDATDGGGLIVGGVELPPGRCIVTPLPGRNKVSCSASDSNKSPTCELTRRCN